MHRRRDSIGADVGTETEDIGGGQGTVFQSHRAIQSGQDTTETRLRRATVFGVHTFTCKRVCM